MLDPFFKDVLNRTSRTGASGRIAVLNGIPVPAFSASLGYYDSYRAARLPANLLQAQRDFFGAHTYERTDKPEGQMFHTEWPSLWTRIVFRCGTVRTGMRRCWIFALPVLPMALHPILLLAEDFILLAADLLLPLRWILAEVRRHRVTVGMPCRGIKRAEEGFVGFSERDLDGLFGTLADQGEGDFFAAFFGADEEGEMLGRDEALILEAEEDVIATKARLVRGGVGHDLDHLDAEALRDLEVFAERGVERVGGDAEPGAFAGHFSTGRMPRTWFARLRSCLGSPGFFADSFGSAWLLPFGGLRGVLRPGRSGRSGFGFVLGPGCRGGNRECEEHREKNGGFHFGGFVRVSGRSNPWGKG
jgi:hypothetical protein